MFLLSDSFYAQETIVVAAALLGKVLVSSTLEGETAGRIVETEAYLSKNDPASHASCGKTRRNKMMFGPPGRAYVYFVYGNHYCFNVVTGKEGLGEAVLIRALEPLWGIKLMQQRRNKPNKKDLTTGPGKLTQALKIDLSCNGLSLQKPPLYIIQQDYWVNENFSTSQRVGISKGKEKLLRFYLKHNQYVSASRS